MLLSFGMGVRTAVAGPIEDYMMDANKKSDKKDFDSAIADYNKVIELNPKYPDVYYLRAIMKKAKGDPTGALADFSKGIEISPNNGMYYYQRAELKKAMGDLAGARADRDTARKVEPGIPTPRDLSSLN